MNDPRQYQSETAYKGRQADGRHLHVFSQSGIKAVETCPERGRRALLKLHPRTYTDSTAMGEAVHLAIELAVQSRIDQQGDMHFEDLRAIAGAHFDEVMALPGSRWVKIKTADTIYKYIHNCLSAFYVNVLFTLSPQAVELHFPPTTIHEDEHRVIQLEGTADYLDAVTGLADWKTASRRWEALEHVRWDVQPTVYSWLLWMGGNVEFTGGVPWTWHVFQTNGEYERIETTRGPADWAWLKERCVGLAIQMEADLPEWFKNDTSFLCSPKWCDAYSSCKGSDR